MFMQSSGNTVLRKMLFSLASLVSEWWVYVAAFGTARRTESGAGLRFVGQREGSTVLHILGEYVLAPPLVISRGRERVYVCV